MDDNFREDNMNTEDTSSENISEEVTEETSTLDVSQEDIDEEMLRYGAVPSDDTDTDDTCEESENEGTKKPLIQKPIIIAFMAILITAVLVLGAFQIYNVFFRPGISGAWVLADNQDSGTYFVFDREGNISMDGGNISYFGYYTMEKNEAGQDVFKTEFAQIAYNCGTEAVVTYSSDRKTMTLSFGAGDLTFVKAKLPKMSISPENITHASADELGATSLNIDNNILGSWSEELYGTYTFNKDGTGSYYSEYTTDYYGCGQGTEYEFKYTISDDMILITIDYHTGYSEDGTFGYYMDNGSLILNGIKFTKTAE